MQCRDSLLDAADIYQCGHKSESLKICGNRIFIQRNVEYNVFVSIRVQAIIMPPVGYRSVRHALLLTNPSVVNMIV